MPIYDHRWFMPIYNHCWLCQCAIEASWLLVTTSYHLFGFAIVCCITLWVCKSNCSILTNAKFKLILCIYVYVYIYLYHFTKYDFAICHFGIPYSVSTPLVLCYLRYFDTWHWCYCLWHTVFQPCWCFFYTWHWHWCCLWHTVFQPSWCYFDIWHRCCLWHTVFQPPGVILHLALALVLPLA